MDIGISHVLWPSAQLSFPSTTPVDPHEADLGCALGDRNTWEPAQALAPDYPGEARISSAPGSVVLTQARRLTLQKVP